MEATLRELANVLQKASDDGTLDELAKDIHPNSINEFCDAVANALPEQEEEDDGLEMDRS